MIFAVKGYRLLGECMEDILSVIKPTENNKNKRLGALKEIANLVSALGRAGALRDASVKPFGSFVSKLYAKSGDLDVSVELSNDSGFPTSKKRKKNALSELKGALKDTDCVFSDIAREVRFIPNARVPVLQYVSNNFGISCDISIDNYPGRIKSRALHWVSTMDDRFGDMVLLVKEWARAQNINDPKNGTLSSYTLCLLVISHFQFCQPAILPPMREIFIASIAEGSGGFNEKHFDQIWKENIAKFQRHDIEQRNQSPLSRLLADFFYMNYLHYSEIYYAGRTQEMTKSSCKIMNDGFDRSDADITVDVSGLERIASAFKRASDIIYSFDHNADRNELLSLLCTPEVCSKLGVSATVGRYTNPASSHQQHIHMGSTGSGPIRRPQGHNSGRQAAAPYWSRQRRGQQNSRS